MRCSLSFLTEFAAALRVYDIYPTGHGYSTRVEDYAGEVVGVAAHSIREAYRLARSNTWIDPAASHPTGVVFTYCRRAGRYTLWCGCRAHGLGADEFARPRHGSGVRAIRQAVEFHAVKCDARRSG